MMWMMGSGIQIFSIFMVMSGLFGPLMAIYRSGQGEAHDRRQSGTGHRRPLTLTDLTNTHHNTVGTAAAAANLRFRVGMSSLNHK
jgi:hypothetical protein